MKESTPALFLPLGSRDWIGQDTPRHLFLRSVETKLKDLGLRPGWGFRGNQLPIDGWAGDCAEDAVSRGWSLNWHPGYDAAFGIALKGELTPKLIEIGEIARRFKETFDLEALVIHPDALQLGGPEDPKADLERYNSKLTAAQVLRGIKNHVPALRELNEICGGILLIENVHTCLFNEKTADELPTYYAAQLGHLDLAWMAEQAGIGTVLDSEHFFGTFNFIYRLQDFWDPAEPPQKKLTPVQAELANIAGYYVYENDAPWGTLPMNFFPQYLELLKPRLFHLGGSLRLVDEHGRVNTHIETNTLDPSQRLVLLLQLDYMRKHGGLGAEVEVDSRPGWSEPRSADGNVAKLREYLTIMDAYEKLQKGVWKVDPSIKL